MNSLPIILHIVWAIVAIPSLLVVVHYLFLSSSSPKRFVVLLDQREPSGKLKLYYGALFVGWLISAYFAAFGMLSWIPSWVGNSDADGDFSPLRSLISTMLAFMSLSLIDVVWQAAVGRVRAEELAIENDLLRGLLKDPRGARANLATFSKEHSDDPKARVYPRLLRVTETYVKELDSIISHATPKEPPKPATSDDTKRAVKALHKKPEPTAESIERNLRRHLEVDKALRVARESYSTCRADIGLHEDGSYLVDGDDIATQWRSMSEAASKLLGLTDDTIAAGTAGPYSVQVLLNSWPGTAMSEGNALFATYTGNSHGGRTEVFAERSGSKDPLESLLHFDSTVASMVSAFFVTYGLPTFGIFWHGLYGHDYRMLFTNPKAVHAILEHRRDGDAPRSHLLSPLLPPSTPLDVSKLDRPPGLRINRSGDVCNISCLAGFPNGSVFDFTLRIEAGKIAGKSKEEILPAAILRFY